MSERNVYLYLASVAAICSIGKRIIVKVCPYALSTLLFTFLPPYAYGKAAQDIPLQAKQIDLYSHFSSLA